MRASGPSGIVDSSGKKSDITITRIEDPARITSYADYADIDVLNREFILGKELLIKAIKNITPEYLNSLKEHTNASDFEIHYSATILNLLRILNKTKNADSLSNWAQICEHLNDDFLTQLSNLPEKIQQRDYDREKVFEIREQFRIKPESSNDSRILHNFKEAL